jgi:phosphoribosyl 1,2-cyclic phosphodiesterase
MRVTFWGVRGSVPWANRLSIGYGCNTPCVEVRADSGERLILDAGSGIVGLGEAMQGVAEPISLLLTHYHWDHLQGLPFFGPLYQPRSPLTMWTPCLGGPGAAWIGMMFQSPFFPVPFEQLPGPPKCEPVRVGRLNIGGFDVRAIALNHPSGAFAYRIRGTDGDLVYATDHELGVDAFDGPLAEFAAGARAIIFDAHFTPDEAASHRGWGHSTWAEAAQFCAAVEGIGRLWLFHHKPGRTDQELTEIEAAARKIFPATDAAAEGDTFDV